MVGAQCGNSARWDLRGGPPARAVPTATPRSGCPARAGERTVIVKSFRSFWGSLQKMAAWMAELGVTDAAMESTGVIRGHEMAL